MSMGGKGLISVVSNIIPEKMMNIYNFCKDNDFKSAINEYNRIHTICNTCFITSNPVPLKMILHKMNLITSNKVLLPLKSPIGNQQIDDQIDSVINLS